MASSGRFAIFSRFSRPRRSQLRGGLASPLLVVIGLLGGALVHVLPLPLLALAALSLVCLALIPQSPLTLLVILLTLSPLRGLMATELDFALPLDIGQILLPLYLGFWAFHRRRRDQPIFILRRDPVLLASLGLAAVFGIGAWGPGPVAQWLSEWLKWLVIVVLVWQLPLSNAANWRWMIFAVLVGAVANAVVGLYIFFGGSGADHLRILGTFFRAFGTFGQPNPFGGFIGLALPFAIASAMQPLDSIMLDWRAGRPPRKRLLARFGGAALCVGLLLAALLASWSRGAWLGFALSCIVMLVAWHRRLRRGIALALLLALLCFLLLQAGLLPRSIANRLTAAATDLIAISDVRGINFTAANFAVVERLAHWQAAESMARAHPLFGVGLGSYATFYEQHRLINWEDPLGHAHNLYLNLLAEAGIVGLGAYLLFWVFMFWLAWSIRQHPDAEARAIGVALLGCWSYLAAHSLFDNLYVNNLFLHIGVLLAVLAILRRQVSDALRLERA